MGEGQRTGGPGQNRKPRCRQSDGGRSEDWGAWTEQEAQMHINCLELLAVTLAVQTFAKNWTDATILLMINNTSAVAYINNQGGTVSPDLVSLAKDLWMWCLKRSKINRKDWVPSKYSRVCSAHFVSGIYNLSLAIVHYIYW